MGATNEEAIALPPGSRLKKTSSSTSTRWAFSVLHDEGTHRRATLRVKSAALILRHLWHWHPSGSPIGPLRYNELYWLNINIHSPGSDKRVSEIHSVIQKTQNTRRVSLFLSRTPSTNTDSRNYMYEVDVIWSFCVKHKQKDGLNGCMKWILLKKHKLTSSRNRTAAITHSMLSRFSMVFLTLNFKIKRLTSWV